MTKRNLLNLSLLIFVIILVSLAVYEPGKKKAITPPTLTNLKAGNIYSIKIIQNNKSAIELKKTNNNWAMLKPYQLPANNFRIESILKLASAPSLSKNDLNNLDKRLFGLDKPLASISFNDTEIVFGNNKSLKNHRYVSIDSTLHMTADTFYYQLLAKAESYIDHKLIPSDKSISKLKLPKMNFVKNDGKWKMRPSAGNVSADSINQLMSEWQLSQAYDVEKHPVIKNTKPDITVYLSDTDFYRFKIGKNKDSFNLTNIDTGVHYILSSDRRENLLTLLSVNQDKKM